MPNVDINDLALLEEQVEVTSGANPEDFFSIALPDDGTHTAVLHLGDRGISVGRQRASDGQKTGAAFLNVHLQARILGEDRKEGLSVFDNPTSIVMQSAGTSKLHVILDLLGSSAPSPCSLGELKSHVEQVLAQSPQIGITTVWEAQVNRGSKEKPDYQTVAKGQKRFPSVLDSEGNPTGKFTPEVQDPRSGEIVKAQVRISKYSRA